MEFCNLILEMMEYETIISREIFNGVMKRSFTSVAHINILPPLPTHVDNRKYRITTSIKSVAEKNFHIDVVRAASGHHNELRYE